MKRCIYFAALVITVFLIASLSDGIADELVLHLSFDEDAGKVAKDL